MSGYPTIMGHCAGGREHKANRELLGGVKMQVDSQEIRRRFSAESSEGGGKVKYPACLLVF